MPNSSQNKMAAQSIAPLLFCRAKKNRGDPIPHKTKSPNKHKNPPGSGFLCIEGWESI